MHPWRRTSGGWDPIPGTLTNIKDALDVYRAYRVLYYPKTFHITNSRYERYACTTISSSYCLYRNHIRFSYREHILTILMHCDRRISISARRVFGGDMSEKDRYTSISLQRYEPHDRDKKCTWYGRYATWYGRYASDSRYVEGLISVHIGSCRHTPIGCPYRSNGVHIVSISCQIMKISRHEAIWKAQDISTKISTYWIPYRYLGEYGSRIWGTLGRAPY